MPQRPPAPCRSAQQLFERPPEHAFAAAVAGGEVHGAARQPQEPVAIAARLEHRPRLERGDLGVNADTQAISHAFAGVFDAELTAPVFGPARPRAARARALPRWILVLVGVVGELLGEAHKASRPNDDLNVQKYGGTSSVSSVVVWASFCVA